METEAIMSALEDYGSTYCAKVIDFFHLEYQAQDLRVPFGWAVSLNKYEVRWAWLHRHASSAASAQKEGAAYPKEQ